MSIMSFFQIVSIFSDNMGYFFFMFGIPLYLRKFHGLGTEDVRIRKIIISIQKQVQDSIITDWVPGCNTFHRSFSICFHICKSC